MDEDLYFLTDAYTITEFTKRINCDGHIVGQVSLYNGFKTLNFPFPCEWMNDSILGKKFVGKFTPLEEE